MSNFSKTLVKIKFFYSIPVHAWTPWGKMGQRLRTPEEGAPSNIYVSVYIHRYIHVYISNIIPELSYISS